MPFGGRSGGGRFEAPRSAQYVDRLPLATPMALADLSASPSRRSSRCWRRSGTRSTSTATPTSSRRTRRAWSPRLPRLDPANSYVTLPTCSAEQVREIADSGSASTTSRAGWPHARRRPRAARARLRRPVAAHPGGQRRPRIGGDDHPQSAITRSDAILKVPSNDPLTAMAIARTLAEVAPDHPLTRHLAVAYWKGGDSAVEEQLYRPEHIEKIVAWGGFASVKHVTRYIQPGLELIALDPKRSATIIGPEAFDDEDDAARGRAARRLRHRRGQPGGLRQRAGDLRAVRHRRGGHRARQRLGEMIYDGADALPDILSTPPKSFDRELYDHLDASRMADDWYRVIGGEQSEGASSCRSSTKRWTTRPCCRAASPTSCRSTTSTGDRGRHRLHPDGRHLPRDR